MRKQLRLGCKWLQLVFESRPSFILHEVWETEVPLELLAFFCSFPFYEEGSVVFTSGSHHLSHLSQLSITMATASGLTSGSVVMYLSWSSSALPQRPTKPLGRVDRVMIDHKDIELISKLENRKLLGRRKMVCVCAMLVWISMHAHTEPRG